jgi:hypothetical protein
MWPKISIDVAYKMGKSNKDFNLMLMPSVFCNRHSSNLAMLITSSLLGCMQKRYLSESKLGPNSNSTKTRFIMHIFNFQVLGGNDKSNVDRTSN